MVLTGVLVWPALWAAPGATLGGLLGFVESNSHLETLVGAPTRAGLGGWFYPLTWLLRSTPLAMLGLALLGAAALARLVGAGQGRADPDDRLWPALTLVLYVLGFGAIMTVAAKNFDRYILPAFLPLDLLAGLGLALAARRLSWMGGAGYLVAGAVLLPALIYPLASSLPYPLAWYNPLAGGGAAAQRTLPVGWGEGLDQVAAYLNGQRNAARLKVAMSDDVYRTVLDAQFVGTVMTIEGSDPSANDTAYLVRYIRAPLDWPPIYDARYQSWTPEQVVRIGGIEYAQVYPARLGVPLGADFGGLATLEGYGLDSLVVRAASWSTPISSGARRGRRRPRAGITLTLTDLAGREVARSERPAGPTRARAGARELHPAPGAAGPARGRVPALGRAGGGGWSGRPDRSTGGAGGRSTRGARAGGAAQCDRPLGRIETALPGNFLAPVPD